MAYLQDVELNWNTFKVVRAQLVSATLYYLKNDLQYVPFLVQESTAPMVGQSVYYCGIGRDPGATKGPYAVLTSGVKASAHIQDITYTATAYGVSSVTLAYVADALAVGKESVTVSGNAIIVHIAIGSIAQQVYAAIVAWNAYNGNATFNSQAAAYLVSAVIDAGREGIVQVAVGATALAGGTTAVTAIVDWETNFMPGATLVPSISVGVGLEL